MRLRLSRLFFFTALAGGPWMAMPALAAPSPLTPSKYAVTARVEHADLPMVSQGLATAGAFSAPTIGSEGVGEDQYGHCEIWDQAHPTALGYHPFGRGKGC
jgi:hypothetical protein